MAVLVCAIAIPLHATQESDLFSAVASKNLRTVKKLVKQGVSLNSLNQDGKTVLDIAAEKKYGKISRYLVRNGAKVTTADNARMLAQSFKRRGVLMIVFGALVGPSGVVVLGLIIGGVLSLADRSMISVL